MTRNPIPPLNLRLLTARAAKFALLVLPLVLAACGSSDSSGGGGLPGY